MTSLSYAAHAYWTAALNVRSGDATSEDLAENLEDLMAILSNLEFPDTLYLGAVHAMNAALDRGFHPTISDDNARDLEYALSARDEMEEERWAANPPAMDDAEPEVVYLNGLRGAEVARNG